MIKLTDPKNGWITMLIHLNENKSLEIDFSDVGPNTIEDLMGSH